MLSDLIKRRSTRKFKEISVEENKLENLMQTALLSPTSRNIRSWSFVFVTDKEKIKALSLAKLQGSSFLAGASLAIVVIGDPALSDVWVEDASIASAFLQMEAQDLGLGSCWIQIRKRMHNEIKTAGEYVKELLQIPSDMAVESIIAVGYPEKKGDIQDLENLPWGKVYREKYEKNEG